MSCRFTLYCMMPYDLILCYIRTIFILSNSMSNYTMLYMLDYRTLCHVAVCSNVMSYYAVSSDIILHCIVSVYAILYHTISH